jgi:predicted glycoside hydrolase/deacetylase ChbG (UPF0249 family)
MSETVNQAVHKAYSAGRLSSATLLVGGAAVDSAIRIARQCPKLGIGLHLNLDRFLGYGINGYYGRTISNVNPEKYKEAINNLNDIKRCIKDQFVRFFSFGLQMSHVDGHHNVHLLPGIFESVLEIASVYHVRGLRLNRFFYESELPIYEKHCNMLRKHGFKFVSDCRTFRQPGSLDNLNDDITEIIAHLSESEPGSEDWRISQFERLMSINTRNRLSVQHAQIISYNALWETSPERRLYKTNS